MLVRVRIPVQAEQVETRYGDEAGAGAGAGAGIGIGGVIYGDW